MGLLTMLLLTDTVIPTAPGELSETATRPDRSNLVLRCSF
jgi:hypothetical protein